MRIAFFDPFSGASGDMILGALIDAGALAARPARRSRQLDLTGYDPVEPVEQPRRPRAPRSTSRSPEDQPARALARDPRADRGLRP